MRLLAGWTVRAYLVIADRVTRASPVSTQAEARNIKLVRGDWNAAFLDELEAFPEGDHDDQVDALSGAEGVESRVGQVAVMNRKTVMNQTLPVSGGDGSEEVK